MTATAPPASAASTDTRERSRHQRGWVYGLLGLGALAFVARALVIVLSIGTNDIIMWFEFAEKITQTSVGQLYDEHPLYNHPPLMGWLASGAYSLSRWSGIRFEWLFKAPMLFADLACAGLLFQNWKDRGAKRAAAAFALFCWNPVSMLIGAYHGNTDVLCVAFMLLAAVLMDRARPFSSGLALAVGINVKLIPLLLIAPLWACVQSRRDGLRFVAGLSIGVLPFLPYLIGHWPGFYKHALAYRSNPRLWGIPFIARQLGTTEHLGVMGLAVAKFWAKKGTWAVLSWPLLLGAWRRYKQPDFSARELAACTLLGFLVFAPGWGVQYLVYPVALLFAVSLEGALWYSAFAGLTAFALYASLWTGQAPWYSDFLRGEPVGALVSGCLVWMLTARLAFDLLRSKQRAPHLAEWRWLPHWGLLTDGPALPATPSRAHIEGNPSSVAELEKSTSRP